jgi:hypothetical protein
VVPLPRPTGGGGYVVAWTGLRKLPRSQDLTRRPGKVEPVCADIGAIPTNDKLELSYGKTIPVKLMTLLFSKMALRATQHHEQLH